MESLKIVVEGDADIRLLTDLVRFISKERAEVELKPSTNFIKVGSNVDSLMVSSDTKDLIRNHNNRNEQSVTIAVMDADQNFDDYLAKLKSLKDEGLIADYFLFPNNQDAGNLETILEKMVQTKHQSVIDCFKEYQSCLTKQQNGYFSPDNKTMLYAYVAAIAGDNDKHNPASETKRNYLNAEHWDLNHPSLNPLKEFLLKYVQ